MLDYTAFYLVIKDEICLRESCEALIQQGVKRFLFCVPATYWDGTPVSLEETGSVFRLSSALEQRGMKVKAVRLCPSDFPGEKYVITEALIRNKCLREVKKAKHVLIVDGDEIWRKGALGNLDQFVRDTNATVATIGALSIAGFPGYPVKVGQEGLLVYIQTGEKFLSGRSTCRIPKHLTYPGVFHFTSTRRTWQDTVDKHRRSLHYDDLDYAFEDWIKNKLPRLKPGEKNCHMYKPQQVWSEIRHFTQQEWGEIPDSLRQYLGSPA